MAHPFGGTGRPGVSIRRPSSSSVGRCAQAAPRRAEPEPAAGSPSAALRTQDAPPRPAVVPQDEEALRRRVTHDASDAVAWQGLADAFLARGAPGRALACRTLVERAEPGERRGEAAARWRALRKTLRARELAARRRSMGDLLAPDRVRASVILASDAAPARLREAVDSVLAQSVRDLEVVVVSVGDRSPDATGSLARRDSRIRTLHAPGDSLASARNRGLLAARGRFVGHLAEPDRLHPDHLAIAIERIEEAGVTLCHSEAPGDALLSILPVDDAEPDPSGSDLDRRTVSRHPFAPAACVVHRRRGLADTGLFDPELSVVHAWHLWRRLALRGGLAGVAASTVACGGVGRSAWAPISDESRFHVLLARLEWEARGERLVRRSERRLQAGDALEAMRDLERAWWLGVDPERFVAGLARLARVESALAVRLVRMAGAALGVHLGGAWKRIARGAEARRALDQRILRDRHRRRLARGLADGPMRTPSLACRVKTGGLGPRPVVEGASS